MKPISKILNIIKLWPEELRRFFAVFIMIIAIVIVLSAFSQETSSRITTLSLESKRKQAEELDGQVTNELQTGEMEEERVLSPTAGLGESFKSLEQFFRDIASLSVSSSWEDVVQEKASDVLDGLAGVWGAMVDTVWKWIYLP